MTLALGVIADDYTGASDLANTLTKEGLRTVQAVGVPHPHLTLPDADAVVIALKSRSLPVEEAVDLSLRAHGWLKARGAGHILFKICSTFDSTDEGNIGPVTEALKAVSGVDVVPVSPAFPETGRMVFMGHLFVNGVPLNESPLKDHPLNPMTDSDLVRVLGRQSWQKVGRVDLPVVAQGAQAVRAQLAALAGSGCGSAIIDAVFERDLETMGEVALPLGLSTGASGLGLGLARALLATGQVAPRGADVSDLLEGVRGPAAIVAGSCSAATLEQVAVAEGLMPVRHLSAERIVLSGGDEVADALAWARAHLENGPVLIAASDTPRRVAALQETFGRAAVSHAVERATSEISQGLVEAGVRRLIIAGGETSGASVDRLKLPAFQVGPEIAPGVPVLRVAGGTGEPLLLALKSGNFGGRYFFADALRAMGAWNGASDAAAARHVASPPLPPSQ